jgi:two-component system NtrC family response regulator
MATVLLIDDDADVVEAIVMVLRESGHDATGVPGQREALTAMSRHPPAVVLVDYNIPGEDARDTIAAVKAAARPPPRIVLCTGAEVDPASIGADALLRKPFTLDALLDTIERHGGAGAHPWADH